MSDTPVDALLDLAAAVAYAVARPMTPVTAFVAGLAAGRGADGDAAARALTRLAKEWPSRKAGVEHGL